MKVSGTWRDLSLESFDAAHSLLQNARYRSCVSRAYYCAYSATTGALEQSRGADFAHAQNPSHAQLVKLVRHNLERERFSEGIRQELARRLRFLRRGREVADYVPSQTVDRKLALTCVRHAASVLNRVGVK